MPRKRCLQWLLCCSLFYFTQSDKQYFRVQPQDIAGLIGSNITIPCVIAPPHGDVQWTKDGLALGYDRELPAFPTWSIIGDEQQGEFNFFVQSLKLDDEGLFACEVSPFNDAPALKQIAHIRTLVPPTSVQISDQSASDVTGVVTMRFDEIMHQIHCRVDQARPAAHIKWFNATGQEYPATSRTFMQDRLFSTISTLTLAPSLASIHHTNFTCHVLHEALTNAERPLRTSFQVLVTSPPSAPRVQISPSSEYLLNGSSISLSCQSSGGYPSGQLHWYRWENSQKQLLNDSLTMLHEQNVTENNISMIVSSSENNVTLSCQVINEYLRSTGDALQSNVNLKVAFGPSSVKIEDKGIGVTNLVEGVTRRFHCRTSSSNPPALVVWKLDGQVIEADYPPVFEAGDHAGIAIELMKTIGAKHTLRDYHDKTLSCEARNPQTGHTGTDSTRLNIIYDATSMEMHGLIRDRMIRVGETIVAECLLNDGNPIGTIQWYKGKELLPAEDLTQTRGKFALSRVQFVVSLADHQLPLVCQGLVANFTAHVVSFSLNVTFLPETIMIVGNELLSNLSLDNGGPGELECRTSVSNPQAQLKVTRRSADGQEHADIQYKTASSFRDGINSIKFLLPPIDLSLHGGQLICEAIMDTGVPPWTKQVTYDLYVRHKPYFPHSNAMFDVREDHSLNITLQASGYPTPIHYSCLDPLGEPLSDEQCHSGQLTLTNIQKTHAGVYQCFASNTVGKTAMNIHLNVLYGPTIVQRQGYESVDPIVPGSSVRLSCLIDANPIDAQKIRWFKGDSEIVSSGATSWEVQLQGNVTSLIGKSVHRDDAGEYTCEVENAMGNSRATLPLWVQYAPEIDRTEPQQSKAAVDADRYLIAVLHCSISAIPPPAVLWMKENQTLFASSKYASVIHPRNVSSSFSPHRHFDVILHIINVTKSDHGIYQCQAENSLGVDITEIVLTGLTVPDPPSQLRPINTSHSSISISWATNFDGGAAQTYQLRYRLSTDDQYSYEPVPGDAQSFDLENLRAGQEYHLSMRSNNTHYLSEWTDELIVWTTAELSFSPLYSFILSPKRFSWVATLVLTVVGLLVVLINIVLISIFVIKRRRARITNDNSSTTGTNETETNTVDLFQPMAPNLLFEGPSSTTMNTYPFDNYQKYDDDDIKRPFVSSYSSTNLNRFTPNYQPQYQENISSNDIRSYATIKREHCSPYDNLRLHNYSLASLDRSLVTYRSFKDDSSHSRVHARCVQAELV